MHAYIHTFIHTYTHTCIHTCILGHIHEYHVGKIKKIMYMMCGFIPVKIATKYTNNAT